MAFPQTPLTIGVEMYLGGVWTDITADVYARDKISISRGRANEGSDPEPDRMQLTLDNRTGVYSPRRPTGTYYGQIGRNTKIRCWVKTGQPRLRLTGGQQFTAADSAGLSITGDIDLRVDSIPYTWRPNNASYIGGPLKGNSYGIYLNTDGTLTLFWYAATVFNSATSTEPVPGATTGRKSVRATLDVNNGAGGWTAVFYYSSDDTMDGTWTQFGSAVSTTSGTTSIDDTTNSLGAIASADVEPCDVNEIRVYQGIAGTKRASPKFTTQTNGATSFADAEGNTWSDSGATGAKLDNLHYRFWGEVSSWPVTQDNSGTDVYVQLVCQGMTRRLGQGSSPLKSALRRGIPAIGSNLVAYFPLEDGATATTVTSGLNDTAYGRVIGKPTLAEYAGFVASKPVPTMQSGRLLLPVPYYTNTDAFQVRFVIHIPPNTIPTNTVLCRIKTNNSLGWIDWIYQTGDVVYLQAYSYLGVATAAGTTLDITNQVNGQDARVSLEFNKNGTGVDIKQVFLPIGEDLGYSVTDTLAGITLGSAVSVYLNPDGAAIGDTAFGHVTVEKAITSVFDSAHALERGYAGEGAISRVTRLAGENSLTANIRGSYDDSEFLGKQDVATLLDLLREAATVDGGFLTEQRQEEAIVFRPQEAVYNQPSRLTISYADNNLVRFEPVEDDQLTRNKVSVQRDGGQTATVEDTDSVLGTAVPPTGVGIYDSSTTLQLYSDGQAFHHAGWRVRLGTVNEARLPSFAINLAHPDFANDAATTRQVLTLEPGDRVDISNPPSWLPPDTIKLIMQGYTETFWQYEYSFSMNTTPASPYRAATFEGHPTNGLTRFSNENTTVNGAHNSTTTSLSVAFGYGPIWSVADGSFDIMVAGERMTVTAVTGSSSPQSLTVTRSVNGVVKSQASGAKVALFDPAYYALGSSKGTGLWTGIDEGRTMKAMDFSPPDVVAEYGNGTNTITSTTFAALPTAPCKTQIVNPHPRANLLCLVSFGCWCSASANDVRVSLRVARAEQDYIGAGIGLGGSIGYGEIPATALTTTSHVSGSVTLELEPSILPYTFEIYALRTTSGTQDVRYATIRIVPLRYVGI